MSISTFNQIFPKWNQPPVGLPNDALLTHAQAMEKGLNITNLEADYNPYHFDFWCPWYYQHLINSLPSGFPHFSDFWVCIPLALALTCFRFLLLTPWSQKCFARFQIVDANTPSDPEMGQKFPGSIWRLCFYTCTTLFGLDMLFTESWMTDPDQVYFGWPVRQLPSNSIRAYYFVSIAYYLHSIVLHFYEPRLKDFWEMLLHHAVTLLLLSMSYCANFVRIGCLTLILHDCSDVFLEAAKSMNYLQWKKSSEIGFAIFAVVFFVTRIILFPWRVIYGSIVNGGDQIGHAPIFYSLIAMLVVLQGLHAFWFSIIVRMAVDLNSGNELADAREKKDDDVAEKKTKTKKTPVKVANIKVPKERKQSATPPLNEDGTGTLKATDSESPPQRLRRRQDAASASP